MVSLRERTKLRQDILCYILSSHLSLENISERYNDRESIYNSSLYALRHHILR